MGSVEVQRPSRGSTVKSRSHPPFSQLSKAGAGDLCCRPKPLQLLYRQAAGRGLCASYRVSVELSVCAFLFRMTSHIWNQNRWNRLSERLKLQSVLCSIITRIPRLTRYSLSGIFVYLVILEAQREWLLYGLTSTFLCAREVRREPQVSHTPNKCSMTELLLYP